MQKSLLSTKNELIRSPTPPLDSSIEDIDESRMEQELENLALDDIACSSKKPHFLDYDAIPPPGFEDDCCSNVAVKGVPRNAFSGEHKMEKKYERDGEVSDFELASNYKYKDRKLTDEELYGGNCSNFLTTTESLTNEQNTGARKKKHFLDENPIPPDYELEREREHRSLDRNFERTKSYDIKYERNRSLDRERPKKIKEPSYTLARFLEHDTSVYRGTWPSDRPNDTQCSSTFSNMPSRELKQLGPKVECVYSLLSMLGCNNQSEMSTKFLELSKSPETCATLRHSRCIPLIVQIIHSDSDEKTKKRASQALHNVVNCHPDDKAGRREAKVLRHIEQIMEYCDMLKSMHYQRESIADDSERHPLQAICSLMKISFDEEHRHAMCQLGALQAIANLVHYDHAVHGHNSLDDRCISLRRYAGMALTNLTFGDGNNKALLCTNRDFMKALVAQLNSTADDLLQVTASVLRNLSWRADSNMKAVLNEIGTVTALSKAAMKNSNENTLKALLSALWNLSAHCSMNKAEFCAVDGALAFLCDMLVYEGPSKTLAIIENAGGILRNVSSHIAVKEDYRKILRSRNCLGILLQQLSSESLTVVSNACGTLWNLSARCPEDQKFLLDNKAVSMLSLLIHSKHKMISNGSSAALKNLLNFRPGNVNHNSLDPIAKSMKLKELPSLNVRKQRALEQELDQNLSETCENIDVTTPPKEDKSIGDFIHHYESPSTDILRLTQSTISRSSDNKDSLPSSTKTSFTQKSNVQVKSNVHLTDTNSSLKSSSLTEYETELKTKPKSDVTSIETCENKIKTSTPEPQTSRHSIKKSDVDYPNSSGTYQETDLDQITDYSLRYGENPSEETDHAKPSTTNSYGNEILLIIEDSVKCYQTEGTPYVISNAPSVSDLRTSKNVEAIESKRKLSKTEQLPIGTSGINTPEKPTKYCEEGTPGYFSHCDSFSSLDEESHEVNISTNSPKEQLVNTNNIEVPLPPSEVVNNDPVNPSTPGGSLQKAVTFAEYMQETPLMFSRHSSLDSISSAEPVLADDRSSVISDFSRLASGIISPSEIPDSPTQIMPNSPRRNPPTSFLTNQTRQPVNRLRSVFEDEVNAFGVENTPAQFSCATSLSNLSLEDEPKIVTDIVNKENETVLQSEKPSSSDKDKMSESEKNRKKLELNTETGDFLSDSDESDGGNDALFQTCINLGMNRVVKSTNNPVTSASPATNNNVDNLKVSDVLLSDDSTSSSDVGKDNFLEQCIKEGMQKSTTKSKSDEYKLQENVLPKTVLKENPIGMLRKGGIPSYIPPNDEINKFNVEDSPCNYSVMSGLSDLTVGSGVAGLVKMNREPNKTTDGSEHPLNAVRPGDDSLSSVSFDSEDDGRILNEAIVAGSQAKLRSASTVKPLEGAYGQSEIVSIITRPIASQTKQMFPQNLSQMGDTVDSLSSIDSSDSNDNHHAHILEECIRSGMHKEPKDKSPINKQKPSIPERSVKTSSPKRSQLPTLKSQIERDRQKERDRKDEQILMECITTGMMKVTGNRLDSQIKPPTRHQRQILAPTDFSQRFANLNIHDNPNAGPKNGETTSAAVSGITVTSASNMVSGVETEHQEGTDELKRDQIKYISTIQTIKTGSSPIMNCILSNSPQTMAKDGILQASFGSLNRSSDSTCGLDYSNEYPALKLSAIDYLTDESRHEEMEISNEYLMERTDEILSPKIDKHKDPDLMLKSVDRLTQELVSTAEYLRTNGTPSTNDDVTTVYENKSSSNSNNTWNEDTCPNDVSFPSISMTVPMIASMNDDDATFSDVITGELDQNKEKIYEEITPTNDFKTFITTAAEYEKPNDSFWDNTLLDETLIFDCVINSQPDSLDTDSNTVIDEYDGRNSTVNFQVGGAVQPTILTGSNSSFKLIPSIMTNSQIIAIEAKKLASDLIGMQPMSESNNSLDLDNIRPPSGMDCISFSGFSETPISPQLSKNRKKSLPLGLMARRALSHAAPSGSLESVNSSCILDNIKPPSLMDELLDSMISVSSITSEVIDNNSAYLNLTSHYETALSDADDTITLRSCLDLPMDATPIPSDMSSEESTPKKIRSVKRILTPRQKRQMVKERYRTYTIAADIIVKEKIDEIRSGQTSEEYNSAEDVTNTVSDEVGKKRMTAKQRRQEDKSRFQTQVLDSDVVQAISANYQLATNCNNGIYPTINQTENRNEHQDDDCAPDDASFISNDDSDISSIRAFTSRLKYINDTPLPIGINPNAMITRMANCSMESFRIDNDFSSIDFEQNSETESCDQNHIDEETYTLPKVKPKIVIPICKIEEHRTDEPVTRNDTPPEGKAIRGKKKVPYVSPYRKTTITNAKPSPIATNRSSLPVRNSLETKKAVASKLSPRNQMIVAKTHVLINKTTLTNKLNSTKSGAGKIGQRNIVAEKNLINKRGNSGSGGGGGGDVEQPSTKPPTPKKKSQEKVVNQMPDRQGTFIKDSPACADVPVVPSITSPPPSPAKSKLPSKLPTGKSSSSPSISRIKMALQRTISSGTDGKTYAKTQPATPSSGLASPIGSGKSANDTGKKETKTGFFRSPSTPTVRQRSGSNTSLKLTKRDQTAAVQSPPPSSRTNSNGVQPKRDVTSRIASIWKRSDETKTAQPPKGTTSKPSGSSKMIRSSTFDSSSNKNDGKSGENGQKTVVSSGGAGSPIRRLKNIGKIVKKDDTKRISRLGSFINVEEQ